MCASVPQIPPAAMRNSTSRAPIRGCGTSRTSIRPTSQSTQAFIPASSPQRLAARSNDPRTPPPRQKFSAKISRQRFLAPLQPRASRTYLARQPPPLPDSNQKIPSSPHGPPKYPLPAHESELSTGARQPRCSQSFARSIPPQSARSKSPKEPPKPMHRKNPQSLSHQAKYKIPTRQRPHAPCGAHRSARPQSKRPAPAARVSPDPPTTAVALPPGPRHPHPPPKKSSRSPSRPWASKSRASANPGAAAPPILAPATNAQSAGAARAG